MNNQSIIVNGDPKNANNHTIAKNAVSSRTVGSENLAASSGTPGSSDGTGGRICAFHEIGRIHATAETLDKAMIELADALKYYDRGQWENLSGKDREEVVKAEQEVMNILIKTSSHAARTLRDFIAEVAVRSAQLPLNDTAALVSIVGTLCETHARSFTWVCEKISKLHAELNEGGAK